MSDAEVVIEDIVVGEGTEVKKGGALITAHYRGFLEDGTEFDSSYKKDKPFTFLDNSFGFFRVFTGDEFIDIFNKGEFSIL